jgi:hypothetical protein
VLQAYAIKLHAPILHVMNVSPPQARGLRCVHCIGGGERNLIRSAAILLHIAQEFVPQMVAVKELLGISLADAKVRPITRAARTAATTLRAHAHAGACASDRNECADARAHFGTAARA